MNINVTFSDSDVILALEVPEDMTAKDLRVYAQQEAGFKVNEALGLFHNGDLVKDTDTLTAAGLKSEDMVQIKRVNTVYAASSTDTQYGGAPNLNVGSTVPNNSNNSSSNDTASRIETARQQILYDPQMFAQLSQQSPELADALHDPEQFQLAYRTLQRQQMKAKAENEEIDRNFRLALEEMPEAFSFVTMLFANIEVNGVPVKAFIDSGAQTTIMSPKCAESCQLSHLIDKRHRGMAYGVGQATILGRIHMAPIKIGNSFFACSMTVIEGTNIEFLLGLDMLKHHQATIDLKNNKLIMGNEELPFLSESEIPKNLNMPPGNAGPAIVSKPGTRMPRGAMNNPKGVTGGNSGNSVASSGPFNTAGQKLGSTGNNRSSVNSGPGTGSGAGGGPSDATSGTASSSAATNSQQGGNLSNTLPIFDAGQPFDLNPPPGFDETVVSNLMGLGFTKTEVINALTRSGGNPDVAAAMLFGE